MFEVEHGDRRLRRILTGNRVGIEFGTGQFRVGFPEVNESLLLPVEFLAQIGQDAGDPGCRGAEVLDFLRHIILGTPVMLGDQSGQGFQLFVDAFLGLSRRAAHFPVVHPVGQLAESSCQILEGLAHGQQALTPGTQTSHFHGDLESQLAASIHQIVQFGRHLIGSHAAGGVRSDVLPNSFDDVGHAIGRARLGHGFFKVAGQFVHLLGQFIQSRALHAQLVEGGQIPMPGIPQCIAEFLA